MTSYEDILRVRSMTDYKPVRRVFSFAKSIIVALAIVALVILILKVVFPL